MIVINVLWATFVIFVLVPARGSNKSFGQLALRQLRGVWFMFLIAFLRSRTLQDMWPDF